MISRPAAFSFSISLAAGFLLTMAALRLFPLSAGAVHSWAVLTVDAAVSDRELGEKLGGAGIVYLSESTMEVLLDDFGEILRVPLDRYDEYIESFDPRNDGYAARLRSFFNDGTFRRFFLHTPEGFPKLKKKLAALNLAGKAAERSGAVLTWPRAFPLAALGCVLAALFLLAWETQPGRIFIMLAVHGLVPSDLASPPVPLAALCLVPVLLPLAIPGPWGLAAAGFLAALYCVLKPALLERFQGRKPFFPWRLFRAHLIWAAVFLALAFLAAAAGGFLSFLGLLLPWAAAALLLPHWAAAKRPRSFMSRRPALPPRLLVPAVPVFVLAGVLVLALPAPRQVLAGGRGSYGELPGPGDYADHVRFQESFSFRPLGESAAQWGKYYLGPDRLIQGFTAEEPPLQPAAYPRELELLRGIVKTTE